MTAALSPDNLRQVRRQHGIPQSTLATNAGIAPSLVSMYEGGRRNLSPATQARVQQALDALISEQQINEAADHLGREMIRNLTEGQR